MSEKRSSEGAGEAERAPKRRGVESETGGGSESTSRRRVALLAETPVEKSPAPVVDVKAGPPSIGEEDPAAPLPSGLKFAWGSFGRKRVSLAELIALEDPRPDVKRLLKVAAAVDDAEARASAWIGRQAVYVVPSGLPCSVTFVRSLDEVKYIDACARLLFVEKSIGEYETPLVVIGAFKRFPFLYHRDAAAVKRWKAAAGVRRTLGALADERDWSLVCQRGADPTVFNYWAELIDGVTSADFAKVPKTLERFDVSAGVVVPVPWLSRFFGTVIDSSDSEWLVKGAERWIESEWAFLVMEAYGHECYEKGNAWVVDQALIGLCEEKAKCFDALASGVGALSVDKFEWAVIAQAMGEAAEQAGVARSWNDYCTNRSYRYVGFDAKTERVYGKATGDGGGRSGPGPSAVDGRGGSRRGSVQAGSEFGTSVLYRVLAASDIALIGGLDEALGGDVAKRGEHQRRVGDVMADLTGVANSLRRRVSALTNEVGDLKRVVAEREEKIQRLEADLEAEKRGQQERRSEWYRRPDPYARSGGYERSDPYGYYDDAQRYPGYYSGEYRATPAAPSDPYAVPRQADGRNVASERGGPARERGRAGPARGDGGHVRDDGSGQPSGFGTGMGSGPSA